MPYTDWITSEDIPVPEEEVPGVLTAVAQESAVMALARRVPMNTKSASQTVMTTNPDAYWVEDVGAESGLKQTSKASFDPVTLDAAEIAVVLPAKEADFEDASFNLWEAMRPAIGQAFARRIDAAVLAGTSKPSKWTAQAIIPAATAAANTGLADSTAAQGAVIADLGEALDKIEDDGFTGTGYAASRKLRARLRAARSSTGESLGEGTMSGVWDLPIAYAVAGTMPAPALAVAGEWSLCLLGIRQDLTFKVFDQGVITDETGAIVLNLMQQDMLALRCVGRFGFNVAVPATIAEAGAGSAYPFSVLNAAP